jgi:hypothetical protein
MEFISGSFLSEELIDQQSIVINEQLAWNLFKSHDVLNQKIIIRSRSYTIIGVVRESDTKADRLAGLKEARAYIYFDELAYLSPLSPSDTNAMYSEESQLYVGEDTTARPEDIAVLYYEVILPDPISGIAVNDLKSAVPSYREDVGNFLIINNTGRFSLPRLYDQIFPIGERAARIMNFSLSPSELSAQITEEFLVFWWIILFASVLSLVPSGIGAFLTWKKSPSWGRDSDTGESLGEDDPPSLEIPPEIKRV